jgi:hypothetical protein
LTDEIKKLNRSIFIPVIHVEKNRLKQEARLQAQRDEIHTEHEKTALQVRESHHLRARAFGTDNDDEESITPPRNRLRSPEQEAQKKEQRKRFQFEATASDDELEDELDDNLDEVWEVTKRLKKIGTAMGQELDAQNSRITKIEEKTVKLDNQLYKNTERVSSLKQYEAFVDKPCFFLFCLNSSRESDSWTMIRHVFFSNFFFLHYHIGSIWLYHDT